jgi:hypothetical protein
VAEGIDEESIGAERSIISVFGCFDPSRDLDLPTKHSLRSGDHTVLKHPKLPYKPDRN